MGAIVSISVVILIVLIIGGFLLGLFAITSGYARHHEELRQADIEQAELLEENPEYDYYTDELDDGTTEFNHGVADATALFDVDKKALHLSSEVLGNRTEDCRFEEDAGIVFEDFLRRFHYPNPPSEMANAE